MRLEKVSKSRCALCEREVSITSRHHLVPKSQGGREMVDLCGACHKTLHSFFENRTLAKELHTIEAIRQDAEIAKYVAWVCKQPDSRIQVRARKQKR
jgi:5-methylcytosine-specific restriction protein A